MKSYSYHTDEKKAINEGWWTDQCVAFFPWETAKKNSVSEDSFLEDALDFICMMGKFLIHKAWCLNFKPDCEIIPSDLL